LGLNANKYKVNLSAFRAKDDANIDENSGINTSLIKPEENIVLGFDFKINPIKFLTLYANAAGSALTSNQNTVDIELEDQEILGRVDEIYTLNFSSKLQFAGDAGIDFKFKKVGFGFEYKRVDPLYRSLGTFYFQEDFENYTGKINFALLQGKLRFNGKGGLQRNNLSKLRTFTNSRTIANISVTYTPSKRYFANGRYSNFQSDRQAELQNINDSLRITNTTAVYGLTNRFTFDKQFSSTITLSLNYQNLEDLLGSDDTGRSIDNYISSLSYGKRWKEKGMQLTTSLNYNQNMIADRETQRFGGNIRYSVRVLDKKMNISTSVGYFKNLLNGEENGDSYTGRVGLNYKINKKFKASFTTSYLYRTRDDGDIQEIRGNVKLSYIFPSIQTAASPGKAKVKKDGEKKKNKNQL